MTSKATATSSRILRLAMQAPFQDLVLPDGTCYGCGSANPNGLQIKTTWNADRSAVVCTFHAAPFQTAGFPDTMQGGVLATVADCHSCWAAIAWAYRADGREVGQGDPIVYVTAELALQYLRPTPVSRPITLTAWVEGPVDRKVRTRCEVSDGAVTTAVADCRFVRVIG
jgi:acyl-coenzyme A thioesterase PaaI-like protein